MNETVINNPMIIPKEIILNIVKYTDCNTLLNIANTCNMMYDTLVLDEKFTTSYLKNRIEYDVIMIKKSCKMCYVRDSQIAHVLLFAYNSVEIFKNKIIEAYNNSHHHIKYDFFFTIENLKDFTNRSGDDRPFIKYNVQIIRITKYLIKMIYGWEIDVFDNINKRYVDILSNNNNGNAVDYLLTTSIKFK